MTRIANRAAGVTTRFVDSASVGHDLNFTAMTGLLRRATPTGVPSLLFADITSGLLGCTAILAALAHRGARPDAGRECVHRLGVDGRGRGARGFERSDH